LFVSVEFLARGMSGVQDGYLSRQLDKGIIQ
jgi:hypothetical protein